MSALASSSASVNRPHFDSSSSAAFSICAPPALLRIKTVFARNASGGTPFAKTDEAKKRQPAASSAEVTKRDAVMMAPIAEVPTTLKHFVYRFGKLCFGPVQFEIRRLTGPTAQVFRTTPARYSTAGME